MENEGDYATRLLAMSKGDLVDELRSYDHCFVSSEGCKAISVAFGCKPMEGYVIQATPNEPKGLTFHDGAKSAKGMDAQDLAMDICRALGVKYESRFGRGSQLRSCCDALHAHFDNLEVRKALSVIR